MKFELKPYNRNVSNEDLLADLKRVSSKIQKDSVTMEEYDIHGKYHSCTIRRRFGSWFAALEKVGLQKTRTLGVTDEEYFENLENIWTKLGRQPKYAEIQKPFSKYCSGSYEYRFGSWRKALEAFVKYVNEEENQVSIQENSEPKIANDKQVTEKIQGIKHKTNRNINWRLRFIIMQRDYFKCKICGRAPATDQDVVLHVDHIKPWANGGETIMENLQTLCSKCNIGKSNLE